MPDQPAGQAVPRWRRPPAAVLGSGSAALLLAVAYLLAPPMGTDLSAQVARAEFVERYGSAPVDLGWYGGITQYGYSLLTAGLGATVGVRPVGALAAVAAALAFGWLLSRTGARRPLLGGLLGAVVFVGNLASGRITFAVGLALGLAAVCAVLPAGVRGRRAGWLAVTAVLAALATWASPVAGLFIGLAGGALLLAGLRHPLARYRAGALALCLAPAAALAPMALLFGNGGVQPFTAESMRTNLVLAAAVLLAVPGWRVLRVGAVLTAVLLLGAYHLDSPIGSNVLRLPMLFVVPVLAAFAALDRRWLAAALAAVVWWQSPVMTGDLARMGSAESRAAFYRPLVDELARRAPVGRVEVVPLRDHWEAAHVAPVVPLARGWERQVDVDRNPLFYGDGRDGRDRLDPDGYLDWLRRNAVGYVALAPDSVPDRYARDEAELVRAGVPGLTEVWRGGAWRLYAVTDPAPLVAPPGRLADSTAGGVSFHADTPGDVLVRVRWSRWLTVAAVPSDSRPGDPAACVGAGPDGWTTVRVTAPGSYRLTSALRPSSACAPPRPDERP